MPEITSRLSTALADRYRIERRLGEGGMATVYLAEDLKHKRKVAVKVLRPELTAVLGAERFVQEITTTANLQHPHILPLFDSGEADGFLYYVMPYIEGETLRDKLNREKQLPIDEAVKITTDVADALHYAHGAGVIHRDIKPENILLHNGRPIVADFGIALAVSAAAGGRMTETGLSLGTPHYMSPEQAAADRELDGRTDVYSLAAMTYEMLVGQAPFDAASVQAVMAKVLTEKPGRISAERPTVPPNIDAAVEVALAKLPADRFASILEFAKALADPGFRHGEFVGVEMEPVAGTWKGLTITFAATTVVLAGVAVWALLGPTPAMPVVRSDVTPPEGSALLDDPIGVEIALSPDGDRMVYVGEGPRGRQLWERRLDALQPTPIEGSEGARGPVFSPDGLSVLFWQARSLKTVSLSGGLPFTVKDSLEDQPHMDWASDGMVYYTLGTGIYKVPATGGPVERVTAEFDGAGTRLPHVLPDGRGLLVTLRRSGFDASIGVVGPEGVEIRELFEGTTARYAASGHIVYATLDGELMVAPFDLNGLEVTGSSVALIEGLEVNRATAAAQFALSEQGTLVYHAAGARPSYQPVWVDRSGRYSAIDPEWTFTVPANAASLALSPDDDRLAIAIRGEASLDIWVKQLDSGPLSKVTTDGQGNARPSWSPDGASLTFVHNPVPACGDCDRLVGVRQISADGTGEVSTLVPLADSITVGTAFYSPDGRWLVLRTGPSSNLDISVLRIDGDRVVRPLLAERYGEDCPAVSRDSRWLAYCSNETGQWELYVRPFPDVNSWKKQVSTSGGISPVWSHDGRELFYRNGKDELIAVEVVDDPTFVAGRQEVLFSAVDFVRGGSRAMYNVTSDDQRFVMLQTVPARPARLILVQNFFEELKAKVGN